MGDLPQLLSLQPFTADQIGQNPNEVPFEDPDYRQLATDMINVKEGRVAISTFPLEYQNKIKAFYQFASQRYFSNQHLIAKMTDDTFDII